MSQNLANVQKTSLSNFHKEFDHLSVVPEENSAENSERNSSSNRASSYNDAWDKDIIRADQSYPFYENISAAKSNPSNYFPQILPSQHYEETANNQFLGLEQPNSCFPPSEVENDQLHLSLCVGQNLKNSLQSGSLPKDTINRQNFFDHPPPLVRQNAVTEKIYSIKPDTRYYENLSFYNNESDQFSNLQNTNTLPVMKKAGTDLIAKTDNREFSTLRSQSSFSNGGNLEELLNDIETISQDILKISNIQKKLHEGEYEDNENENYNEVPNLEDINFHVVQNHTNIQAENERKNSTDTQDSSYKSQINLIVMPTPMPLIGIEKYRNLQRSCDSLGSQSLDNLSASKTNLKILDEMGQQTAIISPDNFKQDNRHSYVPVPPLCPSSPTSDNTLNRKSPNFVPVPPLCPASPSTRSKSSNTPVKYNTIKDSSSTFLVPLEQNSKISTTSPQTPFGFGNYENQGFNSEIIQDEINSIKICSSTNETHPQEGADQIVSENNENLKFNASHIEEVDKKEENNDKYETKGLDSTKKPKLSVRRKVSIHFKGKKDKNAKQITGGKDDSKVQSWTEKKSPFFDIKFHTEVKNDKKVISKTSIPETKSSNIEPKTPTSTDSKCSMADNKNSICESKSSNSDPKTSSGEHKSSTPNGELKDNKQIDQKQRKSTSASPEHGKHKHGKGETKKCHKKHKKGDKMRYRRGSLTTDRFLRERSFSVCTDRSNILDHRLGLGYGFGFYDDLSDKDSSLSSCDSNASKSRKISVISNMPSTGKIPWCGCWGNGCL